MKHTDEDHLDFSNIVKGYEKFCKINDENNKHLDT